LNLAEWRLCRGKDLRLSRAWHPRPRGEIWNGTFGSARIEMGEWSFQLSNGERFELEV
jgi:hypothetical protein